MSAKKRMAERMYGKTKQKKNGIEKGKKLLYSLL